MVFLQCDMWTIHFTEYMITAIRDSSEVLYQHLMIPFIRLTIVNTSEK